MYKDVQGIRWPSSFTAPCCWLAVFVQSDHAGRGISGARVMDSEHGGEGGAVMGPFKVGWPIRMVDVDLIRTTMIFCYHNCMCFWIFTLHILENTFMKS